MGALRSIMIPIWRAIEFCKLSLISSINLQNFAFQHVLYLLRSSEQLVAAQSGHFRLRYGRLSSWISIVVISLYIVLHVV